MIVLVGQGNKCGDKVYSMSDSIGATTPAALGLPDNWYGGMVKKMFRTADGVYICVDKKDNIINIAYEPKLVFAKDVEEIIPPQQQYEAPNVQVDAVDYESMEVHQLKELADQRGIEYFKNAKKEKMIELLKEGDNIG